MTNSQKILWHTKRKTNSLFFFLRFLIYPYTTINGIKIPVDYKWSFPMLKALFDKSYEDGEINILINTLEKKDKILEIGSGLGLLSAYCAKQIGNENVKTYEANPFLEKRIRKLYKINNVKPELNISLVTDKKGEVNFYAEPNDVWASSLLKLTDTATKLNLRTTNINEIIANYNANYLIIDIEGAEYDLIPKINFSGINKLQIELHKKFIGEEKIEQIINLLKKQNFIEKTEYSTQEQFYFYKK